MQLADAAIGAMKHIHDRVKTITFDNGLEFATHESIAMALDEDIYLRIPTTHGNAEPMRM